MDYDDFAEVYDLSCPGIDGDLDFYLKKSQESGGKVLEVGCGTGRIYLHLKERGVDIAGIDNSKKMLSLLESKASKANLRPMIFNEDMVSLSMESKYNLIFLAYRTFMHLFDFESQLKCLLSLREHLEDNASLIIDLFNPDLGRISQAKGYQLHATLNEKNARKYVWLWEEFDISKQIVRNVFRIETVSLNGEMRNTVVKEFMARWFYVSEFRNLIHQAGLRVESVYGGYTDEPFTGVESNMIWVLSKEKYAE